MNTPPAQHRVRVGDLWIDALGFDEALEAIGALARAGAGGLVFTPNVDHVVNAERNAAFREAYGQATLSLADGQPLVWAARLLGTPLPAKISGSDLFLPLMDLAARRGLSVFLLGASPRVAAGAAAILRARGVDVVGHSSPRIPDEEEAAVAEVAAARPRLLVVALGSPKQELFMHRNRARLAPAVCLGLGAVLDFTVGAVPRAPRWMQRAGLEWLFRLCREPRRLARRYLVDDPRFARIFLRTLQAPRETRVLPTARLDVTG